jgi:hypothetical protein
MPANIFCGTTTSAIWNDLGADFDQLLAQAG